MFEGKTWKCGPLAYLNLQDAKYQLPERWKPYMQYRPLDPACSNEELAEFLRREEEPVCGMCPASPARFNLPIPLTLSKTPSAPAAQA